MWNLIEGVVCWILIIYYLVRKIDTWTVKTTQQYTFPVWKCMIRLRIYAHCIFFHIRCFGINITSMWHNSIFMCSYMWCAFSPDLLLWAFWLWPLSFFKYPSLQESNDACIIVAETQHSQPHMTLYCANIFLIVVATLNTM